MGVAKIYNPNTAQWELSTGAVASDVQSVNGFTGAVLLDAAKVGAADASKVGNLLTPATALCEDPAQGWAAYMAGITLTDTGAEFQAVVDPEVGTAFGTYSRHSANRVRVVPGQAYTFTVKANAANQMPYLTAGLIFFDDTGNVHVGTVNGPLTLSPYPDPGWVTVTGVAPPGAGTVEGTIYVSVLHAGSSTRVIAAGLWAGAGGEWAMPGVPITNLGTRITCPNIDDRLVEVWNPNKVGGAGWSVVDYDSGVRSIAADGAGWSGSMLMRRDLSNVYIWEYGSSPLVQPASGLQILTSLPSGFTRRTESGFSLGDVYCTWTGNRGSILGSASIDIGPPFTLTATRRLVISCAYPATEAIPTSLPGTLVSAAPA